METQPRQTTYDAMAQALMETSDIALLMLPRLDPHDAAMASVLSELLGGAALALLDIVDHAQPDVAEIPIPDDAGLPWLRDVVEDTQRLVTSYMHAADDQFDPADPSVEDALRFVNVAHALAVHWITD